jgi:hypothetical protein
MLSTRFLFYRILFLVLIIVSLLLGISACGTTAANNPLTVLSITGGNVLVQKAGSNSWIDGKAGMTLAAG